jgi:integrase
VSCQDSKLTQEAMRHADFSTTAQHYLRTPTEEINKAILNV